MHNTSNDEGNGLKKQKTMVGSSHVSKKQKAEAALGIGSPKPDS